MVSSPTGPPSNFSITARSNLRSISSRPTASISRRASPSTAVFSPIVPSPTTWAKSRNRRSRRFATRGVPRDRAAICRVPLVLHEQNSVPGLANRILSRWAHAVGTTYEGSAVHLAEPGRAVLTGNPVRASVLEADRDRGRTMFGVDPTETLLLVFGGSRGARHINEAMVSLVPQLVAVPSLRVVHVAGRIEAADVNARIAAATGGQEDRYHVVDYIDAMGDALAAADVVVARAGATSIAEITAVGRAAVLVPYPYATDDHQTLNARTLAEAGAADLVADADLDGPALGEAVLRLIAEPERVARMARASAALAARDATERLVRLVGEAARNGKEMR